MYPAERDATGLILGVTRRRGLSVGQIYRRPPNRGRGGGQVGQLSCCRPPLDNTLQTLVSRIRRSLARCQTQVNAAIAAYTTEHAVLRSTTGHEGPVRGLNRRRSWARTCDAPGAPAETWLGVTRRGETRRERKRPTPVRGRLRGSGREDAQCLRRRVEGRRTQV